MTPVVATWPAFKRLQHLLGGRKTLAALLMVTLATLVFVVPPALAASGVDYNVAGTIRLVRDLSQYGMPPPPAWDAEVEVIGPALYDAGKSWRAADPKQRNASRPP